ncbi:hypothetical protein [Enterococcus cecorum]|uniref:hypothetical protein n=1 Tax=Enterococcus cecorum TaxID=44008 RepID=UPI0006432203|nr:hypothetical protein [Enterococcus cecorum]KLO73815.1 hypothetical protein AA989_06040 [Enterococcus cecorum]
MSVSKYRKIPVEVRAIQYVTDTLGECVQFLEDNGARYSVDCTCANGKTEFVIVTLEGCITVSLGDFIVCGVEGECYSCKPDIFVKTYEKV